MKRYGMAIDVDRCNGCGACMVGLRGREQRPAGARRARTNATGITPIRVYQIDNGGRTRPAHGIHSVLCQQCGHETPCATVCPQQAVDVDPHTGIVGQMPERCLGCRYCMAACPYHARYFNWWDPAWPAGMEKTLNPDVAPRHARRRGEVQLLPRPLARREEKAAAAGKKEIDRSDYVPACAEACPTGAIQFGDLNDVERVAAAGRSFRLLEAAATRTPKIYYRSKRDVGDIGGWKAEGRRLGRERIAMDKRSDRARVKRCSHGKFLLWIAAVGGAAAVRHVRGRAVPRSKA